VFVVGLLVYLGVVTVKLARFRHGALQLAVCLLALEVVGAVLHVGGADMARGPSVNAGNVAASALDTLSGKSMPVEMRGEMGVEVFFITFTIPFRARLVAPRPDDEWAMVDSREKRVCKGRWSAIGSSEKR